MTPLSYRPPRWETAFGWAAIILMLVGGLTIAIWQVVVNQQLHATGQADRDAIRRQIQVDRLDRDEFRRNAIRRLEAIERDVKPDVQTHAHADASMPSREPMP